MPGSVGVPSEAGGISGAAAWAEAVGWLLIARVIKESESIPEAMRRAHGEAKLMTESRLVILRSDGQNNATIKPTNIHDRGGKPVREEQQRKKGKKKKKKPSTKSNGSVQGFFWRHEQSTANILVEGLYDTTVYDSLMMYG